MGFHDDCLVLDGHTDLPTRLWESPADLGDRLDDRQIDLPRLRQGGVDALVAALYVPAGLDPAAGWAHAQKLERLTRAGLPDGMALVRGADELRRTAGRGVVAVLLGLENGRPLTVAGALDGIAAMGVRYVTLTHFKTHEWCDASTDAPEHGGLSGEGVRLVREMNRRGILADVSHVSDDAVRRVLEVAPVPPLASHSSARALCDHPRNLPDELIREIARRDGLVMANSYPGFVDAAAARADGERMRELAPQLAEMDESSRRDPRAAERRRHELWSSHPLPRVPLGIYVDHVIHLVELAG